MRGAGDARVVVADGLFAQRGERGVVPVEVGLDQPAQVVLDRALVSGMAGLRPASRAVITSSSWRRSMGQPRSSKSTCTCAEIGVDVASVSIAMATISFVRQNPPSASTPPEAHDPAEQDL
jgi:hypothetical protein